MNRRQFFGTTAFLVPIKPPAKPDSVRVVKTGGYMYSERLSEKLRWAMRQVAAKHTKAANKFKAFRRK